MDSKKTIKFDWMEKPVSKEEIFSEYLSLLRSFPDFLETETEKIIKVVRSELRIPEIEEMFTSLNFDELIRLKEASFILEHLSAKLGQSLR